MTQWNQKFPILNKVISSLQLNIKPLQHAIVHSILLNKTVDKVLFYDRENNQGENISMKSTTRRIELGNYSQYFFNKL